MPVLPRLRSFLGSLAGRGPVQRDLDAEVDGYLDMLVDEKMAAGLSETEARRQARLEMEGVEQVKESVRAARPAVWLDTFMRDVRYSLRLLRKAPGFTVTAILVLALGIGANAAVFSLVNILLFQRPLGAEQPGEVVGIFLHDPARRGSDLAMTYAEYEAIRDETAVFDLVMAHRSAHVGLADADGARRSKARLATGNYFATLGVRLAAGRSFTLEEERPGSGAAVAVIDHTYWQKLGGSPDILGRTILVNATPFTVIGVAPAGFTGTSIVVGPELWMPLGAAGLLSGSPREGDTSGTPAARRDLTVVARLKPGVTLAAADAAVRGLSDRFDRPGSPGDTAYVFSAVRSSRTEQGARPEADDELMAPIGALTGAALVVLIVAGLNVANMQLARGTSRHREIAMRLALGAGRERIVSQLLIEGFVLALAGGAAGLAASVWTMRAVVASLAPLVPMAVWVDVTPDWRVWLASLAFCTLAAVAFGLGPAWKLSRLDLVPEMKSQDGAGTGGPGRFGPRNLLVAGQVALSLALLAASGLFVRGAVAAGQASPGYAFDGQFLVTVDAAIGAHDEGSGRQAYAELMERIRSAPGVASASPASLVAFGKDSVTGRVHRSDAAPAPGETSLGGPVAYTYVVGASYFRTLGLAMLRGREFTPAEESSPTAGDVAIIDEPLASALFPGEDPLGRFVQFAAHQGAPARSMQIVGIAPGLRHRLADRRPVPHVYLPLGSNYRPLLNIHVRADSPGGSNGADLRRTLSGILRAPDVRLSALAVQTLAEARDASPMNWLVTTAGRTFGAFGAMALFMAAIGLYGVKAYLVARRTREIGVRVALGARAGDVIRMVVAEGAILLAAGVTVGFLLAIGVGQAVSSLLVGVRPFDPLVLGVATLVLAAAVLSACSVPAWRATRVSPVAALRAE